MIDTLPDMPPKPTKPTKKNAFLKNLPLIAILAIAAVGAYSLRDTLSFQTLADNRETLLAFRDDNYVLTVLAFIGAYIAIVAFSLPGAAIATLTGGFLFGLFPGALFNALGATIGATGIFLAAKTGLGDKMSAKLDAAGGAVKKIKDGIKEDEISYLFIMRLVPAVPFFVANLIPAFMGVSLKRYMITTFLGILPGGIVYTWVGAGLGEVFARGETPNLGIIFEPYIIGPILGLAALSLMPILVKKLRKEKAQ
jgi:uncharacterized membrane protein YdjX (TVP38/TMEM64 family)